jgi:hypothetical protein
MLGFAKMARWKIQKLEEILYSEALSIDWNQEIP